MRVGYFITHFPYTGHIGEGKTQNYQRGGAELAAYYLAKELAKRNEVCVFTTSAYLKGEVEANDGLQIYRYGTFFKIKQANMAPGIFFKPLSLELNLDIVHSHFSTPPAELAAIYYAKKERIPLILTYHGDWVENFGGPIRRAGLTFYNTYLIDKVLSQANTIIIPSEYYVTESRFLAEYKNKTLVIPNGINLEEFETSYTKKECREKLRLPLSSNLILFIGAFSPTKGPDVLVKAMPHVLKEIPDTRLILIGEGLMKKELHELAKKLGIEEKVEFTGQVNDADKKVMYYKAADVFVLPSLSEVFPLVLLEASASSLPIIVSNLLTFKSIIEDGYNGVMVKKGDEIQLAKAIITLLKDENLRRKLALNAASKVKDFSWEKIAQRVEKLYEEVINESMSNR